MHATIVYSFAIHNAIVPNLSCCSQKVQMLPGVDSGFRLNGFASRSAPEQNVADNECTSGTSMSTLKPVVVDLKAGSFELAETWIADIRHNIRGFQRPSVSGAYS